jgi:hypothetical protein
MSLLQLLLKPAKRNLLDVVSHLPKLGVGSKVTRKNWEQYGNSYWEVTAVKPRAEDGITGKVRCSVLPLLLLMLLQSGVWLLMLFMIRGCEAAPKAAT